MLPPLGSELKLGEGSGTLTDTMKKARCKDFCIDVQFIEMCYQK